MTPCSQQMEAFGDRYVELGSVGVLATPLGSEHLLGDEGSWTRPLVLPDSEPPVETRSVENRALHG